MNMMTLNEIFKKCSKCKELKEIETEFYSSRDGYCKTCKQIDRRERRNRSNGKESQDVMVQATESLPRVSQLKHKPFIGNAVSENCLIATPFESDLNCAIVLSIATKKEIGTRSLYVATRPVDAHLLSVTLLSVLFEFKAFSKAETECFFVTSSHEYAAYCRIVWGEQLELENVLDHVHQFVKSKDCPKPCPLSF